MEAASVSMRITSVAAPVIGRCASQADVGALMQTARDFHAMATQPPPVGSGIELSDLQALVTLRGLAELSGKAGDDAFLDGEHACAPAYWHQNHVLCSGRVREWIKRGFKACFLISSSVDGAILRGPHAPGNVPD